MKLHNTRLRRPFFTTSLATTSALAAALLGACGGGDDAGSTLSQEVAQGYAADATTMTVLAASSVDSAADALETALGSSSGVTTDATTGASAGNTLMQPQALGLPGATVDCAAGGTVTWGITGGTSVQQLNGQLDAGETYHVTYAACGVDGALVLDGGLTLVVTAIGNGTADLTLTASALKGTTAQGSTTLNGNKRRQRTVVDLGGGARVVTAQLSSTGVTLDSSFGTRQASYELKSLNWTVVRTFSTTGTLTSRTHQGSLSLAASTPRRPNATLQISTSGALTLGSDGLASAGNFSVTTSNDRIACSYGSGTITLELDLGNNGSIDRTWILQRVVYNAEAG